MAKNEHDITSSKRVATRVTKEQLAGMDRLSIKIGDENLIGSSDFLSKLSLEDRAVYDEMFEFMLYQAERGFLHKLEGKIPDSKREEYLIRMKFEAFEIMRLGFVKYILIVWDMCKFARENEIPFNSRGSANASLLLYCLNIISLDPMISGPGGEPLIFARFISPDRIDYPDVDLDFADVRRIEIKQYLIKKYGEDCVAEIATFGTLKGKMCLKSVARVYQISNREVAQVSALVVQRCISGKSRLRFPDGSEKEIGDIVGQKVMLETGFSTNLFIGEADIINTGKKELFELETEDGNKIQVSEDELFFAESGLIHLKDLIIGNKVYTFSSDDRGDSI